MHSFLNKAEPTAKVRCVTRTLMLCAIKMMRKVSWKAGAEPAVHALLSHPA